MRETRQLKINNVEAFNESYPEDERALKVGMQVCAKRCVKFDTGEFSENERKCFNNCLWKYGQLLSKEY